MNAVQLLEVANKVFVNRDPEAQQEAEKKNETESSPASSSTEELRSSEIDCLFMERPARHKETKPRSTVKTQNSQK